VTTLRSLTLNLALIDKYNVNFIKQLLLRSPFTQLSISYADYPLFSGILKYEHMVSLFKMLVNIEKNIINLANVDIWELLVGINGMKLPKCSTLILSNVSMCFLFLKFLFELRYCVTSTN